MTDMTLKKALPRINSFESAEILGHECYSLGLVGNIEYKAPEVIENKPYSFKADCWAFGIIIYYLLTKGKYPYRKDIPLED